MRLDHSTKVKSFGSTTKNSMGPLLTFCRYETLGNREGARAREKAQNLAGCVPVVKAGRPAYST
jgi:hypothetical protein